MPTPDMKPKAYTAWLIERTDLSSPIYWSGPSRGTEFTCNIEEAVKFRFKEDADRVRVRIQDMERSFVRYESRSHQWGFTDDLVEGA